jgi:hypothetical protein
MTRSEVDADLYHLAIPASRTIRREKTTRPVATRDQRTFPLGWSSVQAAELSGVPKRTVQEWRKTGFFVP